MGSLLSSASRRRFAEALYAHCLGNYNPTTSCTYTDVGSYCNDEIGADATELFNYLTGCSLTVGFPPTPGSTGLTSEKDDALIDRQLQTIGVAPSRIVASSIVGGQTDIGKLSKLQGPA